MTRPPDDILARIERQSPQQRLQTKAVRLCHPAFEQKALLSLCDLAELLCRSPQEISDALADHEEQTRQMVPRRSTIHDVGTGLTHKSIICRKRYLDGKSPDQIARETYHRLEAVDQDLGQYDRVRHYRLDGMAPDKIAYTLNCSLALVHQYIAIDQDLEAKHD
jgi:hypothetical protein